MEVVYVRWLDASGNSGQMSLAGGKRQHPLIMHTAGVLLTEDDEQVVIAQDQWTITEDGDQAERVRDVEAIPRVLVLALQRFSIDEKLQSLTVRMQENLYLGDGIRQGQGDSTEKAGYTVALVAELT